MRETGYAPSDGARLYYEVAGEWRPFVMIHAGVADSRQWNNFPPPAKKAPGFRRGLDVTVDRRVYSPVAVYSSSTPVVPRSAR